MVPSVVEELISFLARRWVFQGQRMGATPKPNSPP